MFALGGDNYYIILDVPPSPSGQESLPCCRACLSADGRLFNIHDFKLADAFSYASGSLAVKDQLPQYLCSFCRGVVLKCASFRDMCARTQQQLMTELLRGQLNIESIRRINQTTDQRLKLTLTGVETIVCSPSITKTDLDDPIQVIETPLAQVVNDVELSLVGDIIDGEFPLVQDINDGDLPLVEDINDEDLPLVEDIKDEDLPQVEDIKDEDLPQEEDINYLESTLEEHIKDEAKINIVDINSILEKSNEPNNIVDKLIKDKIPVKCEYIKKGERKVQTTIRKTGIKRYKTNKKISIENERTFKNGTVDNISSLNPEPNSTDNVDKNKDDSISQGDESNMIIEGEDKINDASDKQNLNCIVKIKKRYIQKRQTNVVKKRKKTVGELRKERTVKNKMASNKSFESDYSVQIVFLSKEDRLAEVTARKETPNYKESDYKCQECYKGFIEKAAYENHMLRHNPSVGEYICEICKLRFPTRRLLLRHLGIHKEKIICTICGFVTKTRGHARDHHRLHAGKTFNCPHCNKSFKKRTSSLTHARLSHPALNVTCDVCGEVFVSHYGLRLHKAKMHSEKIQCTTCSAKFMSLAALDRHTDTAGEHADLRPCEQCGENCASETALQEHVREKHPKDHRCEECAIAFPSAEVYGTHVARTHLQQRKIEGRHPASKRARTTPAARAPKQNSMCEQCGRIYSSAEKLWSHQRTHGEVKYYTCHHCSKAFSQKSNLRTHLRSHSGEKPFKCPSCPRTFYRKHNLKRHNTTVHLGIRDSFPCLICGSMSTTKASLRTHVDSKHGGKGWPRSRKRTKYNEDNKK